MARFTADYRELQRRIDWLLAEADELKERQKKLRVLHGMPLHHCGGDDTAYCLNNTTGELKFGSPHYPHEWLENRAFAYCPGDEDAP